MFMPFNAQGGHSASHGMPYQERSSSVMVGSHMNMIPVARPIQSIHGIGPNSLAGQKNANGEREVSDYRRTATASVDKDNHHHITAVNHNPTNARVESGKPVRQFPAKAIMQWDYVATREDELSALAGETILIAGEYKNAGWLWGARIINGQAGGFRLIPANYIEYLPEHPPVLSQTRSIHTAVSSLGAQSMSAQAASHFSQGEPAQKARPSPSVADSDVHAAGVPASSTYYHPHPQPPAVHQAQHVLNGSAAGASGLHPPNPNGVLGSSAGLASAAPLLAAAPAADSGRGRERAVEAWDGEDGAAAHGGGAAETVVGDPDDPFLDGMYEDENGQASVCC